MKALSQALRDLDEKRVNALVEQQISDGVSPLEIIQDCNDGMVAVGELFAQNTYFISQLIYSAEILKGVMKRLEPLLEGVQAVESKGKVVIGTVKGDIHDIGKNIVVILLRGSGFEVIDLGVDVPAERFVEAVRESGAKVLGLSALLNFTYPEMKNVVDAVTEAGLRDRVTIVIGGAPVNEQVRGFAGADYAASDAVAGVEICRKIYS
ncbi:MAG: cobalamin B12-binding domain-containing protein [Desulfobacterales bacterium]